MDLDPGVVVVTGLCAFLLLWYGLGYVYNRRRGRLLFRWLETGLDVLGGEREWGWIGSSASGARVNVVHADPPFRRMEITLLLANRELPILWLVDHLRGRRDRLIIKATLRSSRRGEVEVSRVRHTVRREPEASWERAEGPSGLIVRCRGRGAERQVAALEPWLKDCGAHLDRLSWRKTDPHIQLQMRMAHLLTIPSETLLTDLQAALAAANAH